MSMSLAIQSPVRSATTAAGFPMSGRSPAPLTPPRAQPGAQPAQAAKSPTLTESQLERLVKLVPADVVALYIPAIGLGTLTTWSYYALAVTIGATVLVPLLLYLDARSAKQRVPVLQYVVRTAAFILWAFVIGQPLAPYHMDPVIPALLALVLPILGERLLR
jgi:hypothetical protein